MLRNISKSFVESWEICGEATRRKYFDDPPTFEPMGFPAHLGIAIHRAAELWYKCRMAGEKDYTAAQLTTLAENEFKSACSKGVFLPQHLVNQAEVLQARAAANIPGLVDSFIANMGNLPVSQSEMMLTTDSGLLLYNTPIDYKGILDILTIDQDGNLVIHDIKTTTKAFSQSKADGSYQATMYFHLAEQRLGHRPAKMVFHVFKILKTKIVYDTVETTRTDEDMIFLEKRINSILACVDYGIFPPASSGSWKCNVSTCFFWLSCPYITDGAKQRYMDFLEHPTSGLSLPEGEED